jgi:RND family efflux transporter MFP subunit
MTLLEYDKTFTALEKQIVEQEYVLTDLKTFLSEQEAIKSSSKPGVLTSYTKEQLATNDQLNQLLLEQAQENLEKAQSGISADFKGVVTAIGVIEGSTVTTGSQLITLASNEDVKVVISVSKYDLVNLEIGQSAVVTINGEEYAGTVSRINHMAETNATGAAMVTAEIHIENPDDAIYLGIEAKVKIQTASVSQVIMVPVEAVNTDTTGNFVYVVENGVVVRKDVETGISSSTFIEVTKGLSEGENVITTISTDLAVGMPVTIQQDIEEPIEE